MNLSDFSKLSGGDIPFYLSEYGYITCDRIYHPLLFKTYIAVNWERLRGIVGSDFLFSTITSINSTDILKFDIHEKIIDPPSNFKYIQKKESRRDHLSMLYKRDYKIYIVLFVFILVFLLGGGQSSYVTTTQRIFLDITNRIYE